MTRKSKREIERALEELAASPSRSESVQSYEFDEETERRIGELFSLPLDERTVQILDDVRREGTA